MVLFSGMNTRKYKVRVVMYLAHIIICYFFITRCDIFIIRNDFSYVSFALQEKVTGCIDLEALEIQSRQFPVKPNKQTVNASKAFLTVPDVNK